jgi:transcriptional regulator with XRE-family HTH domain
MPDRSRNMPAPAAVSATANINLDRRIARQLGQLRTDRKWSLDELAERSGIGRATLSRIERAELSPTAAMLGRLCAVYGWTLSRLMAEAEKWPPNLVPAAEQLEWTDPASGYRRRVVSPPARGLRGELVEVRLPAGASITFETSPVLGLEHHLWMLEGSLMLEVEGSLFQLHAGDCLRYVLTGSTWFQQIGKGETRYLVALVRSWA